MEKQDWIKKLEEIDSKNEGLNRSEILEFAESIQYCDAEGMSGVYYLLQQRGLLLNY